MRRAYALGAAGLVLGACLPRALVGAYLARTASEASGAFGWFRADRPVPPGGAYAERFTPLGSELNEVSCGALRGQTIYVLVPGVGGDGVEMRRTVPLLMSSAPAAIFMFRWAPWDERDRLIARLAGGLSLLAECRPHRVIAIAHSGGGVLASFAAGQVGAPPDVERPWLTVLTVASPLAGAVAGAMPWTDEEPIFFFDLGTAPKYPAPSPGVRVVHLRTHAPADREMKPVLGHAPNDVRSGVPGARQVDLPPMLTHAGSLVYVAGRLADGSFDGWLDRDR